jgi:hypothetical protein
MTSLSSYIQVGRSSREHEGNFGKDHSLNYVLAFAALGIFFSIMAIGLGVDGFAAAAW